MLQATDAELLGRKRSQKDLKFSSHRNMALTGILGTNLGSEISSHIVTLLLLRNMTELKIGVLVLPFF